tara:strand:- start:1518 stop:2090 length:573 start_codon:yes stop_codon:yes gene_type:complete
MAIIFFKVGIIVGEKDEITSSPESYNMIGYYIDQDQDQDQYYITEAKQIRSTYRTGMSLSKIKHLLIYINGLCKEYDVNYNLVKSVISIESAWNYKARSHAKAHGLMQIRSICAKEFNTPHSEMYDPYVNVTVGIMYLSKLLKEFPDVESALVAYNEGPTYTRKYKEDYIYSSKYVNKITAYLSKNDIGV